LNIAEIQGQNLLLEAASLTRDPININNFR